MPATFRLCVIAISIGLVSAASPATAQWTRVTAVAGTDIPSVWANGDTIVAGADTAVYISTNAGVTWKQSAKVVAAGVNSGVSALWVRNGRIYAGTARHGVFVSDNLGDTWLDYNQGLVGGIGNSQLAIADLLVRGDSVYLATIGASPWVRNLKAGTWNHYGNALEANQASNMTAIAAGGSRLLATGGFNGFVFSRDPGDADWTPSFLNNTGFAPGNGPLAVIWTGQRWVVGSNLGVFHSPLGQQPWSFTDLGLGTLFTTWFAMRGPDLFASFGTGGGTTFAHSRDGGVTWQELETLDIVFTYKIAIRGTDLYAGRHDGLWHRSVATVSVPDDRGVSGLRFALAVPQPVRDDVRFRFELPEAGRASIELFDVAGRRAPGGVDESWSAGPHEVSWSARDLGPGVYHARLTAGGRHEVVRLVRVR